MRDIRRDWILIPIIALGFLLFTWGNNFDLPHFSHWDEIWIVQTTSSMFREGRGRVLDIRYGTLLYYLYLLAYLVLYSVRAAGHIYASASDIPLYSYVRVTRYVSALFGLVSIYLTCRICEIFQGRKYWIL